MNKTIRRLNCYCRVSLLWIHLICCCVQVSYTWSVALKPEKISLHIADDHHLLRYKQKGEKKSRQVETIGAKSKL